MRLRESMACDWGNPGGPAPTAFAHIYIYIIYIYTHLLFLVFIAPPNDLSIVTSQLESPYGAHGLQKLKVSPNRVAGVVVYCILGLGAVAPIIQIVKHPRRDDCMTTIRLPI